MLKGLAYLLIYDEEGNNIVNKNLAETFDQIDKKDYWEAIASDIQQKGAKYFNQLISGEGILYSEIVSNVCKEMHIIYDDDVSCLRKESDLFTLLNKEPIDLFNNENEITDYKELIKFFRAFGDVDFKSQGLEIVKNAAIGTAIGSIVGGVLFGKKGAIGGGALGGLFNSLFNQVNKPDYKFLVTIVMYVAYLRKIYNLKNKTQEILSIYDQDVYLKPGTVIMCRLDLDAKGEAVNAKHTGIYVGGEDPNGKVIIDLHRTDDKTNFLNGTYEINYVTFDEFTNESKNKFVYVPFSNVGVISSKDVASRAINSCGLTGIYSLLSNNCNYFSTYCLTGVYPPNSEGCDKFGKCENQEEAVYIHKVNIQDDGLAKNVDEPVQKMLLTSSKAINDFLDNLTGRFNYLNNVLKDDFDMTRWVGVPINALKNPNKTTKVIIERNNLLN